MRPYKSTEQQLIKTKSTISKSRLAKKFSTNWQKEATCY